MTFARPDLLTLAPVTGLLLVMSVTSHWHRRRRLARAYGGVHTATRLTQTALGHYPALRLAALLGAALTLTLGAAGLEQDGDEVVETLAPVDLVVAVDVSLSMSAADIDGTRIGRARRLLEHLTQTPPVDRMALSLFADWSFGLVPLTDDPNVVNFFAPWLVPELIDRRDQGTSLATAVSQAARTLDARSRPDARRIILLVTDGEAHGRDAAILDSIAASVRQGISVWTAGIGTRDGAPLMAMGVDGSPGDTPLLDDAGAPVIASYDEALLRDMADAGNGRFYDVSNEAGARALVRDLRAVSGFVEGEGGGGPRPAMPWLALLALPLLLWDALSDSGRSFGRDSFQGADHG